MPTYEEKIEQLRQEAEEFKRWLEEHPEEKNIDRSSPFHDDRSSPEGWAKFLDLIRDPNKVLAIISEGGAKSLGFVITSPDLAFQRAMFLKWKVNIKDKKTIESQQAIIKSAEREIQEVTDDLNVKINEAHQWKQKLQTFINKRKSSLRQEITLIKEALNE